MRKKCLYAIPAYRGTIDVRLRDQAFVEISNCTRSGIDLVSWWLDCSSISVARNRAVAKAIERDFDLLVMQDSDIYCPDPGGAIVPLEQAMSGNDATFAAAIAALRRMDTATLVPNVRPFIPDQIYSADRAGTGLCMIDIRKLRSLSSEYTGPWFARTFLDERHTEIEFGEDFFFCAVLKKYRHTIVVNGKIPTVHAYTDHRHLYYDPARAAADSERTAVDASTDIGGRSTR